MEMNKVLETTKFVVEKSKDVTINTRRIEEFAKTFQDDRVPHWLTESPITYAHLSDADKLNTLFIFNATSFCYWGEPKWTIEYKGEKHDGSWAMIACILRAHDEGAPIFDTEYQANISREEYENILRGNTEIPLFEQRHSFVRENAATLQEKYGGNISNLLHEAGGDGPRALDLIVSNFPSFKDVRTYEGRDVYFYKRAQLLVEDIHQTFAGRGFGNLSNMGQFTACADYKLPQVLRKLGIISYSEGLSAKIDSLVQLPENSPEEVEIRANTIWAIEMMREELTKHGKEFSSSNINDHLWVMGQTKSPRDRPYHRTLTTSY